MLKTLEEILDIPVNLPKTQITSLAALDPTFRHVGYILPLSLENTNNKLREVIKAINTLNFKLKHLNLPTILRAKIFNKMAVGRLAHPARVGVPDAATLRELEWCQRDFLGKTFVASRLYFGRALIEYCKPEQKGGVGIIHGPSFIRATKRIRYTNNTHQQEKKEIS